MQIAEGVPFIIKEVIGGHIALSCVSAIGKENTVLKETLLSQKSVLFTNKNLLFEVDNI